MVPPKRQQLPQTVRHRVFVAVVHPEFRIVTLGQHVVQFQEIDDPVPAVEELVVESPGDDVHRVPRRRQLLADHLRRQLDEHQRRRLERLEETGRHADGNAVPVPELLPVAWIDRDLA